MYITAMQGRFVLPVIWMRHLESLLGVCGIASPSWLREDNKEEGLTVWLWDGGGEGMCFLSTHKDCRAEGICLSKVQSEKEETSLTSCHLALCRSILHFRPIILFLFCLPSRAYSCKCLCILLATNVFSQWCCRKADVMQPDTNFWQCRSCWVQLWWKKRDRLSWLWMPSSCSLRP